MDTNYNLAQSNIGSHASEATWGVPIEQYRGPLLQPPASSVPPLPLRTRRVRLITTPRHHQHRIGVIAFFLVMFGLIIAMIGAPSLTYHLSYLNSEQTELQYSQASDSHPSLSDDLRAMTGKMAAATRQDIALASDVTQVSPSPADAVRYIRAAAGPYPPHIYMGGSPMELYLWPKSPGQSVISYSTCPQAQEYPFYSSPPQSGICTQPMTLTTLVNFSNPALVKVTFSSQWRRGDGTIGHHNWDYQVRNRRHIIVVGKGGDELPLMP